MKTNAGNKMAAFKGPPWEPCPSWQDISCQKHDFSSVLEYNLHKYNAPLCKMILGSANPLDPRTNMLTPPHGGQPTTKTTHTRTHGTRIANELMRFVDFCQLGLLPSQFGPGRAHPLATQQRLTIGLEPCQTKCRKASLSRRRPRPEIHNPRYQIPDTSTSTRNRNPDPDRAVCCRIIDEWDKNNAVYLPTRSGARGGRRTKTVDHRPEAGDQRSEISAPRLLCQSVSHPAGDL